jgi:hypothetical protein
MHRTGSTGPIGLRDWVLPTGLERIRRKLASAADGDRQMGNILAIVLSNGLTVVEAACLEALRDGVHSADVIINIVARRREPGPPVTITTPDALRLRHAPAADCARSHSLPPPSRGRPGGNDRADVPAACPPS